MGKTKRQVYCSGCSEHVDTVNECRECDEKFCPECMSPTTMTCTLCKDDTRDGTDDEEDDDEEEDDLDNDSD